MKKKIMVTAVFLVIILAAGAGFWKWKSGEKAKIIKQNEAQQQAQNQAQNQEQQQNSQNNQNQSVEQDNNIEIPKDWKVYKNDNFKIEMAYSEDKYDISEESGMVHLYYKNGTAAPGSQRANYININIDREKNPQGVETLNQLFQYAKDNPGAEVKRITKETEIRIVGNTQFIITKFYNNGTFFSMLFVAMGKGESYRVSFGEYWNVIKDSQYEMIMKMMESFKIIE